MEKEKKRDRSANYTREETEKLINLVYTRKSIIETKKSDAATWQNKEIAWMEIELEFNNDSHGIFRNAKNLKLKYESIKKEVRKKISFAGSDTNSAPPLSPIERKVKERILTDNGADSEFDSDEMNNSGPEILKVYSQTEPIPKRLKIIYAADLGAPNTSSAYVEPKGESSKEKTDELAKENVNVTTTQLQRRILEEELTHKLLQNKLLEQELNHKRLMNRLDLKCMLLKMKLIKNEVAEQQT